MAPPSVQNGSTCWLSRVKVYASQQYNKQLSTNTTTRTVVLTNTDDDGRRLCAAGVDRSCQRLLNGGKVASHVLVDCWLARRHWFQCTLWFDSAVCACRQRVYVDEQNVFSAFTWSSYTLELNRLGAGTMLPCTSVVVCEDNCHPHLFMFEPLHRVPFRNPPDTAPHDVR